jgi:hypothetical protein
VSRLTSPASPLKEVTILATTDVPALDPARLGKTDVLVTYRVGPYQSGMVRIPKEEFTEETVKAAIKVDVDAKAKYVGMKFTA